MRVWASATLAVVSAVALTFAGVFLTSGDTVWWEWLLLGVAIVAGIASGVLVKRGRETRGATQAVRGGAVGQQTVSGEGASITISADHGSAGRERSPSEHTSPGLGQTASRIEPVARWRRPVRGCGRDVVTRWRATKRLLRNRFHDRDHRAGRRVPHAGHQRACVPSTASIADRPPRRCVHALRIRWIPIVSTMNQAR